MIKKIKFFLNNNEETFKKAKLIKNKFDSKGIVSNNPKYDLAISIGEIETFIKMLKWHEYNKRLLYTFISINTNEEKIDEFISDIKNDNYNIDNIKLMAVRINDEKIFSINNIILHNNDLKNNTADIFVDNNLVRQYIGEGIIISNPNNLRKEFLSYGSSIIDPNIFAYQIVFIGEKDSLIIPSYKHIKIIFKNKNVLIKNDNIEMMKKDFNEVEITEDVSHIKCLKMKDYL